MIIKKKPVKTVNFGAAGCPDYTISPHGEKRKKYISRDIKKENRNDYKTAGAQSRYTYIMG